MSADTETIREALDQIAGEIYLVALGEIEVGPAHESIDEALLILRAALERVEEDSGSTERKA